MDRKLIGMSNYPSVYLSIHPSIYPCFLSADLSACQPIHLSVFCLSIHLLSSLSVYAAVHPSSYFCLCVQLSIFLSTSLFRDLSISLSLYLSAVLWSIHLSSSIQLSILFICISTEAFHPSIYFFIFPSRI